MRSETSALGVKTVSFLFIVSAFLLTSCTNWQNMNIPLDNGSVNVSSWEINYVDSGSQINVSESWIKWNVEGVWNVDIAKDDIKIWDMKVSSSWVQMWNINTANLYKNDNSDNSNSWDAPSDMESNIEDDPFFQNSDNGNEVNSQTSTSTMSNGSMESGDSSMNSNWNTQSSTQE